MEDRPGQLDAETMRRWQEGDPAAFEALVRRWQQPMARFLTRLVGRPDATADLCQGVFLRVYLAGPRYREAGTFAAWLYRIALNVARDAGRKERRQPEPLKNIEPQVHINPADQCEQEELTQFVDQALQSLPEPLREMLVLRHFENLSFEEMARLLDTPASTLKSRFAVALDRLRRVLQLRGWTVGENP